MALQARGREDWSTRTSAVSSLEKSQRGGAATKGQSVNGGSTSRLRSASYDEAVGKGLAEGLAKAAVWTGSITDDTEVVPPLKIVSNINDPNLLVLRSNRNQLILRALARNRTRALSVDQIMITITSTKLSQCKAMLWELNPGILSRSTRPQKRAD